jgi:peptidoglycan-N-acetylglucosamine deacetylase
MYLSKIPSLVQRYVRRCRWRVETPAKALYLTFDDGPTPEITAWVLAELDRYQALATFFWVGNHVVQYPELAHRVIDSGHSIGNHTQNHVNGWRTSLKGYLREFLQCQRSIFEYTGAQPRLFRPPYGRITHTKARYIARTHDIVMMDVIAGDFDPSLSPAACFENVVNHAQPGSIILLHDSAKAWPRLRVLLPQLLQYYAEQGYRFEALTPLPRPHLALR